MTREEKNNALHCLKVMIDEEVCEECDLYGTTGTDHCEADCVRVAIKALEQEPKTGHWIKGDCWSDGCGMGENYGYYYECSNCGETVQDGYLKCSYSYCPYCGAKMKGGE